MGQGCHSQFASNVTHTVGIVNIRRYIYCEAAFHPRACSSKGRYSKQQLSTMGHPPVAFLRAAVLLSLLSATAACNLCRTCVCGSKDAFCVSRTLGDPVADSNDVEMLYIKDSNVTDDFFLASNIQLVRKLHIIDCPLVNMSKYAFMKLYKLELLEISRTQLERLSSKSLTGNTRLRHVDLSCNRLIKVPVGLFSRHLELTAVILRSNRLTVVQNHTFAVNRKLKHLDLSWNLIGVVEPGALHMSESSNAGPAAIVDISNNLLRELLNDTFRQCSDLATLDASANSIAVLHPRAFHGLDRLTLLDLQNNSLEHLNPQVFSPLTSLQELDLSDNALGDLPPRVFSSCTSLRRLLLSRNRLQSVHADALVGLAALGELRLDGNRLSSLGQAFSSLDSPLPQLATLSASGNALARLPVDALRGCPALVELDLSGNALEQVENGAFARNGRLERLRLAGNNALRRLECAAFFDLTALEELDLMGSPLEEIRSVDLRYLWNLKDLRLSLVETARCDCSVFATLRVNGVLVTLENNTLSEECSTYYNRQYVSGGSVDCAVKDESADDCQWKYEDVISKRNDGSRLSVNVLGVLVLGLASWTWGICGT